MAYRQPGSRGEYPRSCAAGAVGGSDQSGKPQCRFHPAGACAVRAPDQAESSRHYPNALTAFQHIDEEAEIMLDTDTKRRIDTARDILVGKVPDPKNRMQRTALRAAPE